MLSSLLMAIPKSILDAKGLWHGKSLLNLSWLPPDKRVTESASRFHVDTDANHAFATITYDWHHEGKRHEGTILICKANKSKVVEMGWVDSWHQNGGVLHLVGEESESGVVKAKGTYEAEKQTWGWTIAFERTSDQLVMTMENVTPKGEAEWAVKATYKHG